MNHRQEYMRVRRTIGVLGLALGLVGCLGLPLSAQEVVKLDEGLFSTKELTQEVKPAGVTTLIIQSALSLEGELEIKTEDIPNVRIVYSEQAKASSRAQGTDYIDLITVVAEKVADHVRINLRAPNPAPWQKEDGRGWVKGTITVPKGFSVEIEAAQFDIAAAGPFRSFIVRASLGKIELSDVSEKVDISTANRRVRVSQLSGDISITTANSTLEAEFISARRSAARFRNEGGDIRIKSISGEVNIRNTFGRIDVTEFRMGDGSSVIRGSSGPVSVEMEVVADGRLTLSNELEDIELRVPSTVAAAFSLSIDADGTIEASGFPFRTDLVEHNRLHLLAGRGGAEITGSVRGKGNIFVRGLDQE